MSHYHYLKIRHREKHEGRAFTVYQTLTKPTRYVARWDLPGGEDNTPADDADYTASSFCRAIDALLLGSRNLLREPPIKQPSSNDQISIPTTTRTLQPELF